MMSVEEVRTFTMSLPESEEIEHWGKPSFRIKNKICAVIRAGKWISLRILDPFVN